jgi:hypothetical protein
MFGVAEFLVRPQFLAEGLGVGSKLGGIERHGRLRIREKDSGEL